MPVFHDTGTIFVHIPKNAGKSIEQALLQDKGSPRDRGRSFGNRAAKAIERATQSRFARRYFIGTIDCTLTSQHLTFNEIEHLRLIRTIKSPGI